MSICDWEQIEDDEDTTLNQQGDMIALRTTEGYVYRVYFNHAEDKAYYALEPSTPAHVKESICKIINALGYEPVEINEED
jgi:hypothetical protein